MLTSWIVCGTFTHLNFQEKMGTLKKLAMREDIGGFYAARYCKQMQASRAGLSVEQGWARAVNVKEYP